MSFASALKASARYLIYPALVTVAIVASLWLLSSGLFEPLIILVVNLPIYALVFLLERLLPYYPEWNQPKKDVLTDLLSLIFSVTVAGAIGQGLALLLGGALSFGLSLTQVWPSSWPILGQLLLAVVLGDLGSYWVHRLQHEGGGWLWRIHAAHHSSGRLYWLNGSRLHPLDSFSATFLVTFPMALLGATSALYVVLGVYAGVHLAMQHSNIDYRLGPLNWIMSAAEAHRWHHSREMKEANHNYGSVVLFWDIVFGTRFLPKDRRPPLDVGLAGGEDAKSPFPQGYWGQLLSPFRRALWRP